MITTITNLLLINAIITMIFLSGFIDEIDAAINKKWKFYHLPKPFSCNLCSVFWASIIYIAIAGPFNLLTIALCLVNAHLTEITMPLITVVKNWLLKIVEWIMPK